MKNRSKVFGYYLALSLITIMLGVKPQVVLADKKVLALVPKFMNHPFFEIAKQGCEKAAAEIGDVECLYIGPSEPDEQAQVQMIQDLFTRGVAGIAISPANSPAIGRMLKLHKGSKIPVITWDNDLVASDLELRTMYIGTENYEMGKALGKELIKLRPQGGVYAIQSGEAAAFNLNERIRGFRDELIGHNWTEASGTPLYNNGDSALAIQQMTDILVRLPNLNAIVPVGGWPQVVQQAYRQLTRKYEARMQAKELIIISGDTLPIQMELLKEHRSHAQVGQRPFEMGYKSMYALNDLIKGKEVPALIHTGLDICTQENADKCLGNN